MNDNHTPPPADTDQIEALLARIQPTPDPAFQDRMAAMPWNTADSKEEDTMRTNKTLRTLLAIAAALVLITVSVLTIPPLRSLAQGILDGFFQPLDSGTQTYEEPVVIRDFTPTPVYTPQPVQPITLESAEAAAPFAFHVPNLDEAHYRLLEASYHPDALLVMQVYLRDGRLLVIEQQPVAAATAEPIGPEAVIEEVAVGDYTAEFVTGYWERDISDEDERGPIIEGETWIDTPDMWRLSWTDGTLFYRLSTSLGQAGLANIFSQEEIVDVAESLMSGDLVTGYETAPQFTPTPVPAD